MGDVGMNMLNLNLVVSAPAVADPVKARSASHHNKPLTKRRNKYEKRREKSRQAKRNNDKEDGIVGGASTSVASSQSSQPQTTVIAENETSSSSTVQVPTSSSSSHDPHKKEEEKETPVNDTALCAEEPPTVSEPSKQESQTQTQPQDSTGPAEPLKPLTTIAGAGTESSEPVARETVSLEVVGPVSRKKHNSSLQDSEARAKYMADYHARPLEMDRRSGATSLIQPSKESTHIFEEETDSTHANATENENENATAKMTTGGPFAQLGLHSNLVHAVTSPRGPFRLERPTIIQARAIHQLLQTEGRNNLFMQ
eukprot:scaffold24233_cov43-Attheya_sp.AAC.1